GLELLAEGDDAVPIAHVEDEGPGALAVLLLDLVGHLVQAILAAGEEDQLCAVAGERTGAGRPDPGRRTRDDDNLPLNPVHSLGFLAQCLELIRRSRYSLSTRALQCSRSRLPKSRVIVPL